MDTISSKDIILTTPNGMYEFVHFAAPQKFVNVNLIASLDSTIIINRFIPAANSWKNPLNNPTPISFWPWPNKAISLDTVSWLTPIQGSGGLIWDPKS